MPVIKNEDISRNDSGIYIKYRNPRTTFSRITDNKFLCAKGGDLFLFNRKDTIKYLKHYVNFSYLVQYNNWGYVYPEITKDANTLYFIDTYKFRYEGKHKLFNRRKDESRKN